MNGLLNLDTDIEEAKIVESSLVVHEGYEPKVITEFLKIVTDQGEITVCRANEIPIDRQNLRHLYKTIDDQKELIKEYEIDIKLSMGSLIKCILEAGIDESFNATKILKIWRKRVRFGKMIDPFILVLFKYSARLRKAPSFSKFAEKYKDVFDQFETMQADEETKKT